MPAAVEIAAEAALRFPAADAGPFITAEVKIDREPEIYMGIRRIAGSGLIHIFRQARQLCGRLDQIGRIAGAVSRPFGIHRFSVPNAGSIV